MRPALQRLLSRPSSLELLRYLVGIAETGRSYTSKRWLGTAAGVRHVVRQIEPLKDEAKDVVSAYSSKKRRARNKKQGLVKDILLHERPPDQSFLDPEPDPNAYRRVDLVSRYGRVWTHEELEFESDFDVRNVMGRSRLVDVEYKNDMCIWRSLFDYRRRVYGDDGIITILHAMIDRDVQIPTSPRNTLSDIFWSAFVDVGFQNVMVLSRIVQYANHIWTLENKRWSKLYTHVMGFFLVNGRPEDVLPWHTRLFDIHPPGPTPFAEMCRSVVLQGGDVSLLRTIYSLNVHRNVYSRVIPLLCHRGDFKAALDWHYFFLSNGDFPSSSKTVEPLIHYLAVYHPSTAARVTRSLVEARVSFPLTTPKDIRESSTVSRVMMNLIHGDTLNVTPKKYSDSLGARWFATRWISLDIAMNGVHALGVQEIGPLSLQAIALRNPDPESVTKRIKQLQDLGISIGASLYSRAIEDFAKLRHRHHLEGLINSDQHPDALEDKVLQEELLLSFARSNDILQYERTLHIQTLASRSPSIDRHNIELRSLIAVGDEEGITSMLTQMEAEKCPVKSKTISQLIRHMLKPRRSGRRLALYDESRTEHDDLLNCIRLLKQIMNSGSYIPILHWREIIRRLGQLGRLNDLRSLVHYLTAWYSSGSRLPPKRHQRLQAQVVTTHPLHPFKILFNEHFQRAVVEWGFITRLRVRHTTFDSRDPRHDLARLQDVSLPNLTAGISLLKELGQQGVHINGPSVRKALLDRFITYFGPGRSRAIHNRHAKARMQGKLSMAVEQVDKALGGKYFSTVDMASIMQTLGKRRMLGLQRRKVRRLAKVPVRKELPGHKQAMYDQLY